MLLLLCIIKKTKIALKRGNLLININKI